MGRRSTGFSLLKRGRLWYVRFRVDGTRCEYATGQSDRGKAERSGREIYARAITGKPVKRRRCVASGDVAELAGQWLEDLPVRDKTRQLYEKYSGYWVSEFPRATDLTDRAIAAYVRRRLREVRGKTVGNETSALRRFVAWLTEQGTWSEPPQVPQVPKSVGGTAYAERRRTRAPELTPDECEQLIKALPERSGRARYPVRARFRVMYETTLRPETLSKLRVPQNYASGADVLTITDDDDKELYGRSVPLSERAQKALDSVCPDVGLIFGEHRYEQYLRDTANKILSPEKARVFTGQHFRSAAITHYLETSGNLPGVQHLAGHKHASTTARYVRPSFRAALDVVSSRKIRVKNRVKLRRRVKKSS